MVLLAFKRASLLALGAIWVSEHSSEVVATSPAVPVTEPPPEGSQRVMQEMTMEAPAITEEDQYGYNMPKQYMCEACKAIVWHLNDTMTRTHPISRRWKEYEVESNLEEICQPPTFEGYGIKKVGGKNRLNGPALQEEDQKLSAGMASIQMGGDSWKKRMAEECKKIVGEKYEDQIYQLWQDGKLSKQLCLDDEPACKSSKKVTKKKKEKKEKKEKVAKPPAEKKKITLDTYMKNMAIAAHLSEDHWTKPRTAEDWAATLAKLPALPPGKDEL